MVGLVSAPLVLQNTLVVWRQDLAARADTIHVAQVSLGLRKDKGRGPEDPGSAESSWASQHHQAGHNVGVAVPHMTCKTSSTA